MRIALAILGYAVLVVSCIPLWENLPQRLYGLPIAGQVVDRATGAPIGGAHVAALWQSGIMPRGFSAHNTRDVCYHAAATVTDDRGQFVIPAWSEWSSYRVVNTEPQVLVYARGYVPATIVLNARAEGQRPRRIDKRLAIDAFSGDSSARIRELFWGFANRDCMYGKESQKSLYPMWRSIYFEARGIATDRSEFNTVDSIAWFAARAALANDPQVPMHTSVIDAFIREHLQ